MFKFLRTLPATLAVAGLLLVGTAAPAGAAVEDIDQNQVHPIFDLIVLRPLGLGVTALGVAVFVPAALVTAVVRPSDIDKPFDYLVMQPFGYTFQDPLGTH
jgi:hypothetical protein